MSTSGGTTTTNTTQKSDPWGPAQPYLTDVMGLGQNTYNSQVGNTAMPGDVAPFSPQTTTALNATAQRAADGSPVVNSADSSIANMLGNNAGQNTLSNFADTGNINPFLTQEFNAAASPVEDAVNAQFGMAGRTGSVANQQAMTRNLGELSANIFGQGYDNAANRALSAGTSLNSGNVAAAGLAPSLASSDYSDLQNLLNVGGAYDAKNQQGLDNQLAQWQYSQQQPWNILNDYSGSVTGIGSLGGTSSGSSTQKQPGQSLIPSLLGAGVGLAAAPMTGGGSLFASLLGF